MSGELVAFLRARLAEDEKVARTAIGTTGRAQLVDMHEGGHECPSVDDNCGWWPQEPCPTLLLLALPYSDHPDYRDGWKP